MKHTLALLISAVLLLAQVAGADVIVAADGSGHYKTVQAAIDAASADSARVIIHIKPGFYHEKILIPAGKPPITLLGDDPTRTILSFDDTAYSRDSNGDRIGTFLSASTKIDSDDFRAENITFENARPKGGGQALAVSVTGDRAAFKNCRFLGWQDTLYLEQGRQYFEKCYIAGNTDFIFGGATAFFENCEIHLRSNGYITAASTPEDVPYGFVFHKCKVTADEPFIKTYLGRPWRPFASVIFMECDLSANIQPVGWDNWRDPQREKTARFAEYKNKGLGAADSHRAAWASRLEDAVAANITVEKVLGGADGWNPQTGDHAAPATQPADQQQKKEKSVYLMTSFRGNGEDGLHLAWSDDGYKWNELPGSFLRPTVGVSKLMRDPSICRSTDGTFHMVWTSGWTEKGFGYASSKDLISWSPQKYIEIMKSEPTTINVWAPEIRYEASRLNFMIYWASTIPGRFPGDDEHPRHWNHRIYTTTTSDFENFTKPRLMFDPGYSCIDAVIIDRPDGRFAMVFKDERRAMLRLRVAYGTILYGPYDNISEPITVSGREGPTYLKIGDKWIVYFDEYQAHKYGAVETTDFKHWTDISSKVDFPFPQRHGTAIEVPASILAGLQNRS